MKQDYQEELGTLVRNVRKAQTQLRKLGTEPHCITLGPSASLLLMNHLGNQPVKMLGCTVLYDFTLPPHELWVE